MGRIPYHPAIQIFHDIKPATNNGLIRAERVGFCRWYVRIGERCKHSIFSINRMRRLQQFTRWLSSQDIFLLSTGQQVGGITLAASKLLNTQVTRKTWNFISQEFRQPSRVELMLVLNRNGSNVIFWFEIGHGLPTLEQTCS